MTLIFFLPLSFILSLRASLSLLVLLLKDKVSEFSRAKDFWKQAGAAKDKDSRRKLGGVCFWILDSRVPHLSCPSFESVESSEEEYLVFIPNLLHPTAVLRSYTSLFPKVLSFFIFIFTSPRCRTPRYSQLDRYSQCLFPPIKRILQSWMILQQSLGILLQFS